VTPRLWGMTALASILFIATAHFAILAVFWLALAFLLWRANK
jgi:hypothetical protein